MADGKTIDIREEIEDGTVDTDGWLTVRQAAARFSLSTRAFERNYWASGIIARYQVGTREYLYKPEDIDTISVDNSTEALGDAPTAALLSQAYAHNQFLFGHIHQQNKLLFEVMHQQLQRLTERCGSLESLQTSMVQAREEALNQSAEREAQATIIEAEEGRKTRLTETFMGMVPIALAKYMGVGDKFANSITAEQLDSLIQLGEDVDVDAKDPFLSKEQLEMLKAIRASRVIKKETKETAK